ncbi:MAG: von Willebrand factor type A domain-containing protein [Phycisphaerales bacterium]|nr:MAG: von Willebrand factor type A domain-containing protein [Phycisphaerales bacterium]
MQREEAEKLLAALIFDDLDETSKAKLLTYLQRDDELRERLADLRMAAKVTSDTVQHGPDPVLGKRRLRRLARLAKRHSARPTIFTVRRLVAAAAILVIVVVPFLILIGPFSATDRARVSTSRVRAILSERSDVHGRRPVTGAPVDAVGQIVDPTPASMAGKYAYDPAGQIQKHLLQPPVPDQPASSGRDLFAKGDTYGIAGSLSERLNRRTSPSEGLGDELTSVMDARERGAMRGGTTLSDKQTLTEGSDYIASPTDALGTVARGYGRGATGEMGGTMGGTGGMGGYGAMAGRGTTFYNGRAAGVPTGKPAQSDGGTVADLDLPVTGFAVGDSRSDRRPATWDTKTPLTVAEPESAPLSWERRPASESSAKPAVKLRAEATAPQLEVVDTEIEGRVDHLRAPAYHDKAGTVVLKYPDDAVIVESVMKDNAVRPEELKASLPAVGQVVEYGWRGDVSDSKKTAELSVDDYAVTLSASPAEPGTEPLQQMVEAELQRARGESADRDPAARVAGPGQKEERERIPILGDKPLIGTRFRPEGMEQQQLRQRAREVFQQKRAEPEGEAAGTELRALIVRDEFHPQQNEPLSVDHTSAFAEEDGTDLPAASRFKLVPVNPWVMTQRDSLSTFALDVDTASYTLCRRYIRGGYLPPAGAVRMEEFVNYFNYHYPQRVNPTFTVHADAAPSPFARAGENLTLLKIGVKARTIGRDQRRAAHLIFVVDSSASMDQADRLPLVQQALDLLVDKLSPADRVSLITCAGEARLHLEATSARERDTIRQAINAIQPAGPTNLLAGLKLGYATARRAFAAKQINHVVLCSDGVANVGQTEAEQILSEVAADRKQGITITCVGVGYGSYNDAFLEALANRGDGSYVFLDSVRQAQRVFVEQLAATLQTVAKDARIQVEFNPHRVRRYRLIGYENRDIEDKRFRDDTVDAGEVGSGQCATALYELELTGQPSADREEDLGTVFVRYRDAETGQIQEISSSLTSSIVRRRTVESDPRFFLAAGAARFAESLRQSEHAQHGSFVDVFRIIEQVSLALPLDRDVRELAELIRRAQDLPRSP